MAQFVTDCRPFRRGTMSTSTFDLEPEVSNMSSVRFLETTAPVARAIQRKQLAVEVGANTPRFEFGVKFAIPSGYSVDPRHPAPVSSIEKTDVPGPGEYEVVPPEATTKMPSTPRVTWGYRGVWADVDHVELMKQKRDSYGRYMTADGRRTLAEMSMSRAQSRAMSRGALQSRGSTAPFGVSRGATPASGLSGERSDRSVFGQASSGGMMGMGGGGGGGGGGGMGMMPARGASRMSNKSSQLFTVPTQMATLNAASVIGGAEGASGLDDDAGGGRRSGGVAGDKKKRPPKKLVHPGETVYNLPPLNHGPLEVFAPTCSAYANRLFIESLTPAKRFVATPGTKHRPLSDYPDPRARYQYVKTFDTAPTVRHDTMAEKTRRKRMSVLLRIPDTGSVEDKKGPSKVYREVVLKPYRTGPIKRDHLPPSA